MSAKLELANAPMAPRQAGAGADLAVPAPVWAPIALFGLAFTLFGALMCLPMLWGMPVDVAIDLFGTQVAGRITQVGVDKHVAVNNVHPMLIRFDYTVDGKQLAGAARANPEGIYEDAEVGQAATVTFLRAAPTWAKLRGARHAAFGYGGLAVLLFPLLGLAVLFAPRISIARRMKLYREGSLARGQITSFNLDPNIRIGGKNPERLAWTFDVAGKLYEGSVLVAAESPLREYAPGRQVIVIYRADAPRLNVLYVPD